MGSLLLYPRSDVGAQMQPQGFKGGAGWTQPANDPPKICQASRDFATRLSTK